jgi:hypothetical protein
MSELSQALGNHGKKHAITRDVTDEAGNVTTESYEFSLITQGVKIDYEKSLYAKAKDAIKTDRAEMGAAWYERKLDDLRTQFEAGEFAFESPRGQKALKSNAFALTFLTLLVTRDGQPIDSNRALDLMASNGPEVKNTLRLILNESFPSLAKKQEGEADPKV